MRKCLIFHTFVMALVKKKSGERGEKQQPDYNYFIARREGEIFWKKDKESLGFALKVSSGFERTGVLDLGPESGWRWWRPKRHCLKTSLGWVFKVPLFLLLAKQNWIDAWLTTSRHIAMPHLFPLSETYASQTCLSASKPSSHLAQPWLEHTWLLNGP